MNYLAVEYGDFFERRGREGYAKGAKEVKEKKYRVKKINIENIFLMNFLVYKNLIFLGFSFLPSFLRPLRNLRALCVQKIPASLALTTSHLTVRAAK